MATRVTFADKTDSSPPTNSTSEAKAGDFNEIKAAINSHADDIETLQTSTGGDLKSDGSVAMTASFNAGSQTMINVANGVNPNDAVNKSQLDAAGGTTETLTVVSTNTINPLSNTPTGTVVFRINGVETDGITNTGTAVSVNAATVGYNVQTSDRITATYSF